VVLTVWNPDDAEQPYLNLVTIQWHGERVGDLLLRTRAL